MSITLDHVGLLVRNIDETIEFYSKILGLYKTEKSVDNGLEFAKIQISDTTAFVIWETAERQCQHVAFALTGDEFDEIFLRIKHAGIRHGNATDGFGEDGNLYGEKLNMKGPDLEIGARGICKSLYFEDPNGHSIEILTYD